MGGDHFGDDDWRKNSWLDGSSEEPDHDLEPSEDFVNILEIGPGNYSAKRWFDQFSRPRVVFVDLQMHPDFPRHDFPDSQFVESDVMDFLNGHEAIPPHGFDYIVACNVLSGARGSIQKKPSLFLESITGILKAGGTLIIEETLEDSPKTHADTVRWFLERQGLSVTVSRDKRDFTYQKTHGKNSFHLEATKE